MASTLLFDAIAQSGGVDLSCGVYSRSESLPLVTLTTYFQQTMGCAGSTPAAAGDMSAGMPTAPQAQEQSTLAEGSIKSEKSINLARDSQFVRVIAHASQTRCTAWLHNLRTSCVACVQGEITLPDGWPEGAPVGKVLLLGGGESGKSTILKQMHLLYGQREHLDDSLFKMWMRCVTDSVASVA